ncbi:hypothetical protein EHS25_010041 [Saitozyma podzolica]|uniref:m7GpppX diphosphatase n=1 Tax=Saitozyma podzolica TaxID=1890683 RepID=A0A427YIF0_9TREE|nr:hypothetical protein EHS25_010041 [Saitozyma podzolica]
MTEADPSELPLDIDTLKTFTFTRVLSQAPSSGSVYLLGKLRDVDAIVHLQQSVLPTEQASEVIQHGLERLDVYLENRPYFSSHAWLASRSFPDLVIKVICPATETHIKKYTAQERAMVSETAEMYERIVVPYIHSFPPSRVEWVYNILAGKKEAERVLYKDDDPDHGFMILPDLKWDQTSMSALYLTVLVQTRSIRTLRDLTPAHLPMLNKIRQTVYSTCAENFGVAKNKLRLFIHYQPSYYHLHVHVVHIESEGFMGMTVGQAHLLDDVISLLELSPPAPEPSILARMTLTYLLGVEHGLYQPLVEASESIEEKEKA